MSDFAARGGTRILFLPASHLCIIELPTPSPRYRPGILEKVEVPILEPESVSWLVLRIDKPRRFDIIRLCVPMPQRSRKAVMARCDVPSHPILIKSASSSSARNARRLSVRIGGLQGTMPDRCGETSARCRVWLRTRSRLPLRNGSGCLWHRPSAAMITAARRLHPTITPPLGTAVQRTTFRNRFFDVGRQHLRLAQCAQSPAKPSRAAPDSETCGILSMSSSIRCSFFRPGRRSAIMRGRLTRSRFQTWRRPVRSANAAHTFSEYFNPMCSTVSKYWTLPKRGNRYHVAARQIAATMIHQTGGPIFGWVREIEKRIGYFSKCRGVRTFGRRMAGPELVGLPRFPMRACVGHGQRLPPQCGLHDSVDHLENMKEISTKSHA